MPSRPALHPLSATAPLAPTAAAPARAPTRRRKGADGTAATGAGAPRPVAPPSAAVVAATDEKLSINVGCVDLGQIDLLVREGFYANRSDFIRSAIRQQLGQHRDALGQAAARRTLVLGLRHFDAAELRAALAAGRPLDIRVLGLASFADDVTPDLAAAAVGSLTVLGALHASPAVKAALAPRLR